MIPPVPAGMTRLTVTPRIQLGGVSHYPVTMRIVSRRGPGIIICVQ